MTTIVTRAGKGSRLTYDDGDANFNNLNSAKAETSFNLSDLTSISSARTNLGFGNIALLDASSVDITGGSIGGQSVESYAQAITLTKLVI